MITIYAPDATDFSTLGLGALAPYEVTIEEQAGGLYELSMAHPMDEAGKWLNIGVGCIVKAPAPVRETPLAVENDGEIPAEPTVVTRRIYRVRTNTGANLHLRQGPSTSTRILSKYRPGTEVVVLSQANGWGKVIVRTNGASGYMSMEYLTWVRDETETIQGDAPAPERVIYPAQSRAQLFRIVSVERDAAEREVRVTARHIFYDLLGNVVKDEYRPEGVAANTVVGQLFGRALNPHGMDVYSQAVGSVTGDYTRRGLVECLLDPDDGVLAQTGARLLRDNFDLWLLPDLARETGVTIRHGKNLLGATLTTDADSVVTRIIPVGQTSDGKPLLLDGQIYVDSPRINDYPVICAQAVEYDVKVGQEGIGNASQARAKLRELAEADFAENGVDLPTVGLDVDFVALGETEEYRRYADLQAVHLYDTVRVVAKGAGIDAAVRVTGYKWDALGRRYEGVTLGEIKDLKATVYGYQLSNQSVKTVKIANGAIGSAQLRDLAVQYAHINTAAVEQLSANSITALKAYIAEIVSGSVTTDELYAGIASIALAQLTTANIENANIDWASINTLAADVAEISKAHLVDADIGWAQIANLTSAVAQIAQAKIGEAVIDGAQITDGTITNAKIENGAIDTAKIALGAITTALIATGAVGTAQIADGSITDAKIVSLNADVINAGTLSVDRLLLKGPDGLFVAINATDEGLTSEQLSQEEYQSAISGSVLVARSVTADKIAAKSITANEIASGTITAAELAAGSVTAEKIAAGSVTTSHVAAGFGQALDISSNSQIQLIAGEVQNAQAAADFATPIISDTPPDDAPEEGKLWIDESSTPSVWRKWRGAEVTTDREYAETRVGCGKNLLKPPGNVTASGITYTLQADGTYLANGTCTGNAGITLFKGILPPGRRYVISGGAGGIVIALAVFNADNTWKENICVSSKGNSSIGEITSVENGEHHRAYIQPSNLVGQTVSNVVLSPQLELGDTATDFEPYQDIPSLTIDNAHGQLSQIAVEAGCRAQQAGSGDPSPDNVRAITGRDSVEIAACGKNLLPNTNQGTVGWMYSSGNNAEFTMSAESMQGVSGMKFTLNEAVTGWSVLSYGSVNSGSKIQLEALKPSTQYTVSFDAYSTVPNPIENIAIRNPDGSGLITDVVSTSINLPANTWTHITATLTTVEALTEIAQQVLYFPVSRSPFTLSVCNLQLEEGSTATAYEPYRSMGGGTVTPTEPLYGLPGAEDIVKVGADGDVTVTRRTAVKVLDGTEDWTQPWGAGTAYTNLSQPPARPAYTEKTAAISSHYSVSPQNDLYNQTTIIGFCVFYDSDNLCFRDAQNATTIDTWKAYLAAQYAAGTPVTIVYELAAPEVEVLDPIEPIVPERGVVNISTDADALTATIYGSGWEIINDIAALKAGVRELETKVTQQADGLEILVSESASLHDRVSTLEFGVDVSMQGVTLRASENPRYTLFLDEDSLDIRQDGVTIASFAYNELWTQAARVRDYLQLGNYTIRKSADGGLAFVI